MSLELFLDSHLSDSVSCNLNASNSSKADRDETSPNYSV